MKVPRIVSSAVTTAVAVAVAQNAKELVVEGERRVREGLKTVREGYQRRRLERQDG